MSSNAGIKDEPTIIEDITVTSWGLPVKYEDSIQGVRDEVEIT